MHNREAADPEAERYLMFRAVVDVLNAATTDGPVVLVLDDLHWADPTTLHLFRHVVSADRTLPVVVIGTFRDTDVVRGDLLESTLAVLRREVDVDRIVLDGLNEEGVLSLMEAMAGHPISEGQAFARLVREETDGNPFFAVEILRHLAETGAIYPDDDGRWRTGPNFDASALPESSWATFRGATKIVSRRPTFFRSSSLKWSMCTCVMNTTSAGTSSVTPHGSMYTLIESPRHR